MANISTLLVATIGISVAAQDKPRPNYVELWAQFKSDFGRKDLLQSGQDAHDRFAIFKSNVDIIYEVNAQNLSYTLGVNAFADLESDEFASQYLGWRKPDREWGEVPYLGKHEYSGETLPASVDWVAKEVVTPVKNQGQCGSCWSFSTTGALEGAWKIATGKLVSLSEQQFVDCDNDDDACHGGLMDHAFKFAESNAICTEASYPYRGMKSSECEAKTCTVAIPLHAVVGFQDVEESEEALMEAVSQQPVSIAIEADSRPFQLYKKGILSGTCGARLNHGVLAVGYGTDDGKDYWKVKNSWGSVWGEGGYVRLLRGKGRTGECGILKESSFPKVAKAIASPTITV